MIYGTLINIPETISINRLIRSKWEREEKAYQLRSVIQMEPESRQIDERSGVSTLAIHQYLDKRNELRQADNGDYYLYSEEEISLKWAKVIVTPTFAIVDKLHNINFVHDIIKNSHKLPKSTMPQVYIDTKKLANDNPEQWIRGFSERDGHIDRGIVYGNGVEKDLVFGNELTRSKNKSVGWTTKFFGSPTKVKVTKGGSVNVLSDPSIESFLKFIKERILPYLIR